jgi:ABC-type antimicrobial peptide transport system permease subunit
VVHRQLLQCKFFNTVWQTLLTVPRLLLLLLLVALLSSASINCSYYDTQAVVLPKMAHDVMLDTRWQTAADALRGWLDATY